jgi:hypothetical protein
MLKLTVIVLVLGFASTGDANTLDRALLGEWQSKAGSYLTFRGDHTFTNRVAPDTITGTWYVRGGHLVTVNKSLSGLEEYTNTCDIILRRDSFSYGACEHVEKRSDRIVTRPESYTMGVVYHRVRREH